MTKLQTAWLVFYFFLFVRIRAHQAKPFFCVCLFVNFALFWRFVTLERYYAEKRGCILASRHDETMTVSLNESRSAKALLPQNPVAQGSTRHRLDVHPRVLT